VAPLCSDRNCTPGWKVVVVLSCHAPLCSDRKLAGLRGVSTVCEMVAGTFGTAGCFLAFSSGVCGSGRRPSELNFWMLAVRCWVASGAG
jgi:hypothetical protein